MAVQFDNDEIPEISAQSYALRLVDLEHAAWENLRRLSLSAGGGGLALSFLVLQIDEAREPDVFPFDIFPWIWGALLVALLLGLSSYLWRVSNLRRAIWASTATSLRGVRLVGRIPYLAIAERTSVVLSVLAIAAAFTFLVIAGYSLSEAATSSIPASPTPGPALQVP